MMLFAEGTARHRPNGRRCPAPRARPAHGVTGTPGISTDGIEATPEGEQNENRTAIFSRRTHFPQHLNEIV